MRDCQSQVPDSVLDAKHEILWLDVPVDNALTLQAIAGMAESFLLWMLQMFATKLRTGKIQEDSTGFDPIDTD